MSELPPIPGVHRRSCPDCGAAVTLTAEQSVAHRQGRTTETHETSCPHCRGAVSYTIARGSQAPTIEDTSPAAEIVKRIKRLFGYGT